MEGKHLFYNLKLKSRSIRSRYGLTERHRLWVFCRNITAHTPPLACFSKLSFLAPIFLLSFLFGFWPFCWWKKVWPWRSYWKSCLFYLVGFMDYVDYFLSWFAFLFSMEDWLRCSCKVFSSWLVCLSPRILIDLCSCGAKPPRFWFANFEFPVSWFTVLESRVC